MWEGLNPARGSPRKASGPARGGEVVSSAPEKHAALPCGYPREYELLAELRDGSRIRIRPILPEDAPELKRAIEQADPETARRRFLGGRPKVTERLLAWLTVLDYQQRFALVGIDPRDGHGIAVARFVSQGEGTAEVAVVVDPAWRRRGVATVLVELLAQAAVERGIHTFTAYYMAENTAVTHLLKLSAGGPQQSIQDGSTDAVVTLDRAQIAAAISRLVAPPTDTRP